MSNEVARTFAELTDRFLVAVVGLLHALADASQVLGETDEFLVKGTCPFGDGHVVAGDALVLPDAMDGAQGGHQCAVRHHHHLAVIGFLEDLRSLPQGQQEGRFDGYEHQHEIHALHAVQFAVILLTEALRMGPQAVHMLLQQALPLRIIGTDGETIIVQQRYFGVDDEVLAVGQEDNRVGSQSCSVAQRGAFLHAVFLALYQPGTLEQLFEQHLAPGSLRLRVAFQGACEVVGILAQALVLFHELGHFALQQVPFLAFAFIGFAHLLLEGLDTFVQGL